MGFVLIEFSSDGDFVSFRDVSPVKLSVHDPEVGYLDITVAGKSIKTVLWRSQ